MKYQRESGNIKQHITPKQALELTEDQFYSLFPEGVVKRYDWAKYHHKKVTIGKMIAYMSVNGHKITINNHNPSCVVNWLLNEEYCQMELCDALWKAVKRQMK